MKIKVCRTGNYIPQNLDILVEILMKYGIYYTSDYGIKPTRCLKLNSKKKMW